MAITGYLDLGAIQHKDGGGDATNTSYLDLGAVQHADTVVTSPTFDNQNLIITS